MKIIKFFIKMLLVLTTIYLFNKFISVLLDATGADKMAPVLSVIAILVGIVSSIIYIESVFSKWGHK